LQYDHPQPEDNTKLVLILFSALGPSDLGPGCPPNTILWFSSNTACCTSMFCISSVSLFISTWHLGLETSSIGLATRWKHMLRFQILPHHIHTVTYCNSRSFKSFCPICYLDVVVPIVVPSTIAYGLSCDLYMGWWISEPKMWTIEMQHLRWEASILPCGD